MLRDNKLVYMIHGIICIITFMLFCKATPIDLCAAGNLTVATEPAVGSNTVSVVDQQTDTSDGTYDFFAKIIKDSNGKRITTMEAFGPWDNLDTEYIMNQWGGDYSKWNSVSGIQCTRLTDDSRKGSIGAWYRNVGTYMGRTVDIKCTVKDYQLFRKAGKTSVGWVLMLPDRIGLDMAYVDFAEFKIEYFDSENKTPIQVKGYATVCDIDYAQSCQLTSPFDELMVTKDCALQIASNGEGPIFLETEGRAAYDDENDSWAQVSVNFESNYFSYKFYAGNYFFDNYGSNPVNMIPIEEFTDWVSYWNTAYGGKYAGKTLEVIWQGYTAWRFARVAVSNPVKTVSDSDEKDIETNTLSGISEEFCYKISHSVPAEREKFYYDSYIVSDVLESGLAYINAVVKNDAGDDISEKFNISVDGQTVSFHLKNPTADNFYGQTYHFEIVVKVNEDADLSPYEGNEKRKFCIPNKGKLEINSAWGTDGLETNQVNTIFYIPIKRHNLTIEKSIEKNEITWAHGTPTFSFLIEGTDVDGVFHRFTRTVEFLKQDLDALAKEDGSVSLTTTVENIPEGIYRLEELSVARYALVEVSTQSDNVRIEKEETGGCYEGIRTIRAKVYVNLKEKDGSVTFYNRKISWDRYSHNDLIVNQFRYQ